MHTFKSIAVLLWVVIGLCPRATADETLADRIEHKIALQSAVAKVNAAIEQLGNTASPERIESLSDFIGSNPSQHRSPEASKRLSATEVNRQLHQDFTSSKQQILQGASTGLRTPITLSELQAKLSNIDETVDAAVDKFIGTQFGTMFSTARERAVAKQRSKLELNIGAPSQREVDTALNRDARWESHHDAFADDLRLRALPRNTVLFDENTEAVDAEIDRVLAAVGMQIAFQFKTARAGTSDENVPKFCISSDSIKSHAEQHLVKAVEGSSGVKHRYGTFAVVSRLIASEAVELERLRLQAFIEGVDLPISPRALKASIEANVALHRERTKSQGIFESSLLQPARDYVVATYVGQANVPPVDAQRVKARIASIIQQKTHSTTLQDRLKAVIAVELQNVRSAMASDQVQQACPKLYGKWRPSDDTVERVYDTGKIPSSFPECLQLAGLDAVEHVLLEEAEAAVVKIVREQVEYATSALRSQLLLLKALEQSQESKLTVDVAAGVPKSSIVSEWTALAEKEWSQSGGPASRFKLFPRTHKEIEKAVSKHFDAIQERIRQRLADRQASGVSNKSASSGDQFERVAKLPTPMETRDTQRSTAAAATSTSDRSGGGAGGGGSPGAGGGAGGSGGGAGGGGSGQDAGDRDGQERERNPGVDGEGPAPDCAILLEDLRAGACGARVMFPSAELSPSGPSPTCDFDPGDIDKSSSQIVQVFWPSIASYLDKKRRSLSPRDKDDQAFELRLHVVVRTDAVRHRMSLLIRAGMEDRFAQWVQANLEDGNEAEFHWSDSDR